MLTIGDPAPDFELLTDEGKSAKLSDYRGQEVVLFFYPKADTPGCTIQACGFRDNYPIIEAAGAVIFGLSPDSPEDLASWRAKMGFPYHLLSDLDHAVAEMYGVWGEKQYGEKVYTGIIRSHYVVGKDGKIADIQYNVKPEESVAQALNFLE
jgi:peroxiredoxin Q/BCP